MVSAVSRQVENLISDRLLRVELEHEPLALGREAYADATAVLMARWTQSGAPPISVYQIGEIGVPGVSDLDFIVVMPEGRRLDWRPFMPESFNHEIRQLYTHPAYICSLDGWRLMPGWLPAFNLVRLWGDELPTPVVADIDRAGIALGLLVDYLLVKLPLDLIKELRRPALRVRESLGLLHSWKYVEALAREAGVPTDPVTTLRSRVDRLRGGWREIDDVERRYELGLAFADALRESANLTAAVTNVVRGCLTSPYGGGEIATRRITLCFDRDASLDTNLAVLRGEHVADRWRQPAPLAAVLAAYAEEWPALGEYLFSTLRRPASTLPASVWGPGLRRHATAMRTVSAELATLGVPGSKYVSFGYRPRVGIAHEFAQLTARIARGEVSARTAVRAATRRSIRACRRLLA